MVVADVIQVQSVDGIGLAQLPGEVRHVGDIALIRQRDQALIPALDVMIAAAFRVLVLVDDVAG